jgi:hypothetical protein
MHPDSVTILGPPDKREIATPGGDVDIDRFEREFARARAASPRRTDLTLEATAGVSFGALARVHEAADRAGYWDITLFPPPRTSPIGSGSNSTELPATQDAWPPDYGCPE